MIIRLIPVLNALSVFSLPGSLVPEACRSAGCHRPVLSADVGFCLRSSVAQEKEAGYFCNLLSQAKAGRQRPLGNVEPGGKAVGFRERLEEEGAAPGGGSSVLHGPPGLLLCLGEGPSCLHSCPSECHCHMSMSCLCLVGGVFLGSLERCSVFMTSRVSP